MKEWQVAEAFREMAGLLEMQGENPYRVRAYRRAARSLERLTDLDDLAREGRLLEIPGVGEFLAEKIQQILSYGSFRELDEARKQTPSGLLVLAQIPGVGPRLLKSLQGLGICDLDALTSALEDGKLDTLPGMGEKTKVKILQGIAYLRSQEGQALRAVVQPLADQLLAAINHQPQVQAASLVGELRREAPVVREVGLVVATDDPKPLISFLASLPLESEPQSLADGEYGFPLAYGLRARVWVVPVEGYGQGLLQRTGPQEYLKYLGEGEWQGLSEEEIYQVLGQPYLPPVLREDPEWWGKTPPVLLRAECMRGDLHSHSHHSDGAVSIEELVLAAQARGLEYLAITDHSQSLTIASGLGPEAIARRQEEIEELRGKYPGFGILSGIEVDILADGSLDLPDQVLAGLDVVIASVHSRMRQSREEMTQRIQRAMQNPHVDVIGHLTGRLIGRREPYEVHMEQLLQEAVQTGTVLEINGSPDRLDLGEPYVAQAMRMGALFSIDSDAHSPEQMDFVNWGLSVARRSGLEPAKVINTWSYARLMKFLGTPKELRV